MQLPARRWQVCCFRRWCLKPPIFITLTRLLPLLLQVPPQPGMVLLGYEVYAPPSGCCQCDGMSTGGIVAGTQVAPCMERKERKITPLGVG